VRLPNPRAQDAEGKYTNAECQDVRAEQGGQQSSESGTKDRPDEPPQ